MATARSVPSAGPGAGEIDVSKSVLRLFSAAPADQGLTPNQFVDPSTGNITDPTGTWATGSWGTGSWGTGSWSTGSWSTGSWATDFDD